MEPNRQYKIIYAESAILDIEEKADYIEYKFRDRNLAQTWYLRLKNAIQDELSTFPLMNSLYNQSPWAEKGVRLMLFRNDVILYSVDAENQIVYIRAVCTKGRDLAAHLEQDINTI